MTAEAEQTKKFPGFTNLGKAVVVPPEFIAMLAAVDSDAVKLILVLFANGPLTEGRLCFYCGWTHGKLKAALEQARDSGLIVAKVGQQGGHVEYSPVYAGVVQDPGSAAFEAMRLIPKKPKAVKADPLALNEEQQKYFQAMFMVLAKVCKLDVKIDSVAGRVGKTAKELLRAGYLPRQVGEIFALDLDTSWWNNNWRSGRPGQQKQPPTLTAIPDLMFLAVQANKEAEHFVLS